MCPGFFVFGTLPEPGCALSIRCRFADQEKSSRRPDALELVDAALFENESIRGQVSEGFADLNMTRFTIGFHAGCRIYTVTHTS